MRRQRGTAKADRSLPTSVPSSLTTSTAIALQHTAGNAAVTALVQAAVQRDEDDDPTTQPAPLSAHLKQPQLGLGADPDWGQFSESFRNRNLVLGEGDAAVVGEHWRRWMPLAAAIHGIPGVSHFYGQPKDVMNAMTSTMIDTTLAGDNPNAIERFNLDDERFGVSTKTVTLKEWRF